MTTKDLRDIAAYVGCPFTYEEIWPTGDGESEEWRPRKSSGYLLLSALTMIMLAQDRNVPLGIKNLKLHLRPIASLTDEEVSHVANLINPGEIQAFARPINKPGIIPCYMIHYRNGTKAVMHYEGRFHIQLFTRGQQLPDMGAVIAYFQFVGVYVPGTINPQYVELQP